MNCSSLVMPSFAQPILMFSRTEPCILFFTINLYQCLKCVLTKIKNKDTLRSAWKRWEWTDWHARSVIKYALNNQLKNTRSQQWIMWLDTISATPFHEVKDIQGGGQEKVQSRWESVNIKGPYSTTRFHVDEPFQIVCLRYITMWESPLGSGGGLSGNALY